MFDINLIRENPDVVRKALEDRQMDPAPVDSILELDEQAPHPARRGGEHSRPSATPSPKRSAR